LHLFVESKLQLYLILCNYFDILVRHFYLNFDYFILDFIQKFDNQYFEKENKF